MENPDYLCILKWMLSIFQVILAEHHDIGVVRSVEGVLALMYVVACIIDMNNFMVIYSIVQDN